MIEPINDNIYAVGTLIRAKTNPLRELVIHKYYKRIYYCGVVDNPRHDQLVYFERELITPDRVTKETTA